MAKRPRPPAPRPRCVSDLPRTPLRAALIAFGMCQRMAKNSEEHYESLNRIALGFEARAMSILSALPTDVATDPTQGVLMAQTGTRYVAGDKDLIMLAHTFEAKRFMVRDLLMPSPLSYPLSYPHKPARMRSHPLTHLARAPRCTADAPSRAQGDARPRALIRDPRATESLLHPRRAADLLPIVRTNTH